MSMNQTSYGVQEPQSGGLPGLGAKGGVFLKIDGSRNIFEFQSIEANNKNIWWISVIWISIEICIHIFNICIYIYIHFIKVYMIYIIFFYTHYIVYHTRTDPLVSVLFYLARHFRSVVVFAKVQMAALRAIAAIFYQLEERGFHHGTPGWKLGDTLEKMDILKASQDFGGVFALNFLETLGCCTVWT